MAIDIINIKRKKNLTKIGKWLKKHYNQHTHTQKDGN